MSFYQHHPDNKKTSDQRSTYDQREKPGSPPLFISGGSPFRSFPTKPDEAMELLIDEDDKDIVTQNYEARG